MQIKKTQHIDLAGTAKFFGGHKVSAGFFESAKYTDGAPVAYIAAIQEFGYPEGSIPSRPFFRNAIKANEEKWQAASSKLMLSVIEGKLSKEQALEQLGQLIKGDIQESIIDGSYAPLSNLTLLLRQHSKSGKEVTGKTVGSASRALAFLPSEGVAESLGVSDKPLIDTGHMMRSVDYVVEKK